MTGDNLRAGGRLEIWEKKNLLAKGEKILLSKGNGIYGKDN